VTGGRALPYSNYPTLLLSWLVGWDAAGTLRRLVWETVARNEVTQERSNLEDRLFTVARSCHRERAFLWNVTTTWRSSRVLKDKLEKSWHKFAICRSVDYALIHRTNLSFRVFCLWRHEIDNFPRGSDLTRAILGLDVILAFERCDATKHVWMEPTN
jgi:hypothetical protein